MLNVQSRNCALALLLLLTACGGGGGSSSGSSPSDQGALLEIPGHGTVFVDANNGGDEQDLRITRVAWGRLVEVLGRDANGAKVPMHSNFVIAGSLASDGQNYLLETNAVTGRQTLTIEKDVTTSGGRERFYELLAEAERNVTPIFDTPPGGAGIFTMVPRNAVVVIQLNDLIDATTLDPTTVRIMTGISAESPFEARLIPDPNHGDAADHDGEPGVEFYTTRVLIDPTISLLEAFEVDPPLSVNGVGFPASIDVNLANMQLRVPTNGAGAQSQLLANPSGHTLTTNGAGSTDPSDPTQPIVRAARAGGMTEVTGDPFNGFLPDREAPRVVGSTPVAIPLAPVALPRPDEFLLPEIRFDSTFCSQQPGPGDILRQAGVFAEVLTSPGTTFVPGVASDVLVRLLLFPRDWSGPEEWLNAAVGAQTDFLTVFDPDADVGKEACFVTVFPIPDGFPENPTIGVATGATVGVRFSEPMSPSSLTAFDSMTLTRAPIPAPGDPPLASSAFVVGAVSQSLDLQRFTFVPDLPLAHAVGQAESYFLTLVSGARGPTDLAGNALEFELPPVETRISAAAAAQTNGGRVSRFIGQDEEGPEGPEWSGQHVYDLTRELIRPRPVQRFQLIADRSQPTISNMTSISTGVVTPCSNFGSKTHAIWRYVDFGISLTDTSDYNLDVEGMNWAPVAGLVSADSFDEFQIGLAHSRWAPDESLDPFLLPAFRNSGLQNEYVDNVLDPGAFPQRVVHEKFRGYDIAPGELFQTPTGTRMMPFPLNRSLPVDQWQTFTWRDTSIPTRAGNFNGGVDPLILYTVLGLTPPANQFQGAGQIQTIGLPLLMEFRCYPDDGAQGINAFDISIAITSSSRPYFRAFTTGGVNTSNLPVIIDPDLETMANGGLNPTSTPTPGAATFGRDPSVYIGALDMVVRISRSYSIWFPATDPRDPDLDPFLDPTYSPPVMEPRLEEQPNGTTIELAYRGTDAVDNEEALSNAITIDNYGDHYFDLNVVPPAQPNHNAGLANLDDGATPAPFLTQEETVWQEDIAAIDGKAYYQVRLTFLANSVTGLVPELSALALAWRE
ncbi:MAG: Ig-like domain-containing protein [bacterium]|nr:Ig-like domain-containing protein [bacterium]